MRRISKAYAILLIVAAGMALGGPAWGCGEAKPTVSTPPRAERMSGMLPVRMLEKGNLSEIHQNRELVFRDAAAWQKFYAQHHPGAPVPAVDFSREMVIAVLLSRNTGGYHVDLTSVEDTNDGVRVTYTETQPPPGAMVIQVLTQPYVLAAVPRRDGNVYFVHQTAPRKPPS
jgi:hypothetical protein